VLLFVGRIQPLKGLDVAVQALARSARTDSILLAVGGPSGPDGAREFARVAALIDALGVGHRVRFIDPQPHHLLSTYYRAADICVVPSRSESFGLVALEAAACGTPVIAAAVGGLTTLVEPDRTGMLIDSRDPDAWAAAVDRILGDASLAAAMSIRGAEAARSYTWSVAAGRLRRLYGDLAAQSSLVECGAV
jgi:D-inositol-3-phosphate glycosyltransferase